MKISDEAEKALIAVLQRIQADAEKGESAQLEQLAKTAEALAHVYMDV